MVLLVALQLLHVIAAVPLKRTDVSVSVGYVHGHVCVYQL